MDIWSIVQGLSRQIAPALIGAAALTAAALLAYLLYRRSGGRRKLHKAQFAALFLLGGWLMTVLGLTLFGRGANYGAWVNFRLFSGYRSAWNKWSLTELQLIVFNMLMFVPLGVLLPLLSARLRRFGPCLVVSVLVTGGIETLQMATGRGIFELDDLLHNTIGSMAGYFLIAAILACRERRRFQLRPVLGAVAIPLALTLLFSGAAIAYHAQELGNVPIKPAMAQDMSKGELTLTAQLPATAQPTALYRSRSIHNMAYGEQVLARVVEQFALTQRGGSRIDGFNRDYALFDSDGAAYNFSYSLSEGTWTLIRLDSAEQPLDGAALETWLVDTELMPQGCQFSTEGDRLRWDKQPPTDERPGESYDYGVIIARPGVGPIPQDLFYAMYRNEYVRPVDALSPAQAFEEIRRGNFQTYVDLPTGYRLTVDRFTPTRFYDTKGFYRPAYRFEGTLNGEEWSCVIPAA